MPAYLDRLSRFVCDIHLEGLEPSTVNAAKAVVLDTIGAMLHRPGLRGGFSDDVADDHLAGRDADSRLQRHTTLELYPMH